MSRHALFSLSAAAVLFSTVANAQDTSLTPLASRVVPFSAIPYQVVGDNGGPRGPQFGYNECNSTTQNQNSLCQTMLVNNIIDFCMWSSSMPDDTISESEAREVAWCTFPTHGTRVIPPGAIQGVQWLYAESYVQVVGFIDQTKLNLQADDFGGELDDFGDDGQGNPLGALVYTNAFGMKAADFDSAFKGNQLQNTNNEQLNVFWVDFIGNGIFCIKACNPSNPNAALLCNHIYDEVGCTYNAVANYDTINGTYTVCDSTDMEQPGQYVVDGVTSTWTQGFAGNPDPPYTPTQVASSNCHTYSSAELFAAAASFSAFSTSSSGSQPTTTTTTSGGTGSSSSSKSGASSGGQSSSSLPAETGGSSSSSSSSTSSSSGKQNSSGTPGSGTNSNQPSQTGSSSGNTGGGNGGVMNTVMPFLVAGLATVVATVVTILA